MKRLTIEIHSDKELLSTNHRLNNLMAQAIPAISQQLLLFGPKNNDPITFEGKMNMGTEEFTVKIKTRFT